MSIPALPFSKTRRLGDTLYLSGELGFDADGRVTGDVQSQTRLALSRIAETLKAQGLDLSKVISCTCYLTDAADFAAFNAAYSEFFSDPLPVRTTVISGLALPEARVEITVIADLS
ncbi:RidA family protein [Pseudodonghicola flavimaris]|uniref:RidA family protein n=1 Tax=Pseudodonghicola flavimaris TaxID=3050036 RepID=A0ABT7F0Q8_9RHOB|nr:RidA family protein [Pseudodonghicola flavimaris]MDK3018183.1 RidA family protein [Pseudodonghicola flavimaris]